MSKDYQTPEDRLAALDRPRPYPWHWVLVAFVLFVYGLAQYITDLGAAAPLVSFSINSCGI